MKIKKIVITLICALTVFSNVIFPIVGKAAEAQSDESTNVTSYYVTSPIDPTDW